MPQHTKPDWILFGTVLAMVSFGLLFLYSASSITAELDPRYHSTWHFVLRQAEWAAVAVVVMMALKNVPHHKLRNPALAFGGIGIAFVLLAAVYFIDREHHRWLRIGPGGFQPSELAKPALVLFVAYFVTWRAPAINHPRFTLAPAALGIGLVICAVAVADLGTPIVLGAAVMSVFFVAGLERRYCFIVAGVALIGVTIFICAEPYRLGRVVRFCDPDFKIVSKFDRHGRVKAWIERSLRTRDTNYQAEQSKIAVGAGGPTGLGLMNGKQKLLYLPEAHTDFIYAVVGEETGLIGTLGLLAGFSIIGWRGLRAAWRLRTDDFGRYLALAITMVVVVQGLLNMSVVLGMMPTKGIPLPMVSYGGSSLLCTLALLGVLMSVSERAG
jgi:cell division protein FtsW